MKERSKALALGIFLLAAALALAWLLLFLRPTVGDEGQTLYVRFSNIEKVNVGTRVTFAGRAVGEVVEIRELFDARSSPPDSTGTPYFYELVLKIDSRIKIYNYDEIALATAGFLGEKTVSIVPKAAPKNGPPAHEITGNVLYARSQDKLQEALDKLICVGDTVDMTMHTFNDFLKENEQDISCMVKSVTSASEQLCLVAQKINSDDLVGHMTAVLTRLNTLLATIEREAVIERLSTTLDHYSTVGAQLVSGQGTLGRLIYSDSLYLKLVAVMSRAEMTLNDINHYGLLFQYDRGWQRARTYRMNLMQKLCTPCDFYGYFNDELNSMGSSLSRVNEALSRMHSEQICIDDPCFAQKFRELLDKAKELQDNLELYNQGLMCEFVTKCQ